ncbi:MAG: hypothetical protein SFZ03_01945 [Candidatus Melainabacteria bacterium]|nr:hypothetical protein [Candidatus Melainabacteria bacterium]
MHTFSCHSAFSDSSRFGGLVISLASATTPLTLTVFSPDASAYALDFYTPDDSDLDSFAKDRLLSRKAPYATRMDKPVYTETERKQGQTLGLNDLVVEQADRFILIGKRDPSADRALEANARRGEALYTERVFHFVPKVYDQAIQMLSWVTGMLDKPVAKATTEEALPVPAPNPSSWLTFFNQAVVSKLVASSALSESSLNTLGNALQDVDHWQIHHQTNANANASQGTPRDTYVLTYQPAPSQTLPVHSAFCGAEARCS